MTCCRCKWPEIFNYKVIKYRSDREGELFMSKEKAKKIKNKLKLGKFQMKIIFYGEMDPNIMIEYLEEDMKCV
jgi:hypothetical protein